MEKEMGEEGEGEMEGKRIVTPSWILAYKHENILYFFLPSLLPVSTGRCYQEHHKPLGRSFHLLCHQNGA